MKVLELDEQSKDSVREEWNKRGATLSDLSILDIEFACNTSWYVVNNNDNIDAVFEVRQAPNYLKNMKVLFAPDININIDECDYKEAKPIVVRMVNILASIFSYHLKDLADRDNSFFKIYSDHAEVRLIFYEFCRYLEENYPDQYKLKLYGKWIEIHENS